MKTIEQFEAEFPQETAAAKLAWQADRTLQEVFHRQGMGLVDFVRMHLVDCGRLNLMARS